MAGPGGERASCLFKKRQQPKRPSSSVAAAAAAAASAMLMKLLLVGRLSMESVVIGGWPWGRGRGVDDSWDPVSRAQAAGERREGKKKKSAIRRGRERKTG